MTRDSLLCGETTPRLHHPNAAKRSYRSEPPLDGWTWCQSISLKKKLPYYIKFSFTTKKKKRLFNATNKHVLKPKKAKKHTEVCRGHEAHSSACLKVPGLRIDENLRAEIGGLIEGSWWWMKPVSHGVGFTYSVTFMNVFLGGATKRLAPQKKLGREKLRQKRDI